MKKLNMNHVALITVLMMCCLITVFAVTGGSYKLTEAEEQFIETDTVRIAHITDMHYYPIRFCYNGPDEDSAFEKDMRADTRLLIENSAVYMEMLKEIKENGQNIDYILATGDLAKDGERAAHIDVANSLRKLQNDIREAGNPDFQIFVVMGNHDIYNSETYTYSENGYAEQAEGVTRKDISIIYSSLGFPDITEQEAQAFYTPEELAETIVPYETDGDSFINSTTADGINIERLFEQAEDYETETDYAHGELSYYAVTDNGVSFLAIDEEDSNEEDHHVLTATVTENVTDFFTEKENTDNNGLKVAFLHHNLLPQYPKEPTLLSGFIVNDWVMVADYFADLGVRYAFSGHSHANSISNHISFNNNQIIDTETAASVSYVGCVRYNEIKMGTVGGKYAEKYLTENTLINEVDFTPLIEEGYLDSDFFTENNVSQYMEGNICKDISEYSKTRIYVNVIDNYMVKYLSPEIIPTLVDMVKDYIPDSFGIFSLSSLKNMLDTIVVNLISEIETKVLDDYVYSGDNPLYQNGQNKLLGYLEELLDEVRALSITSDNRNIIDIAFACFFINTNGEFYGEFDDLPAYIKEGITNLENGSVVRDLIGILLNKETGLYRILEGLLTETLNLSEGLTYSQINSINGLGNGILNIEGFNIASVNIDELLRAALSLLDISIIDVGSGSVLDFIDEEIDSYLTDSLCTGLGEIASDILLSFALDYSIDASYDAPVLIAMNTGDTLTYIDEPRPDNPTVLNGKLPSKLSVNFGPDASTTKNFVWFTDKRVDNSVIKYSTKSDMSGAVTANGEFEIYAHTYAQIDVGVFATYGVSEIGRHTLSLTGLTPATTYYYQVGSSGFGDNGYFSPVYSFKTAPSENSAFDVLLFSDPQGYTSKSYKEVFKVLNDVDSVFSDGYDFVMSPGDNVDNSQNMAHYDYLFDTDQAFWGNTTFVTAIGNHETSAFEEGGEYTASSESVVVAPYNNSLLYTNLSLPEQNTLTGAYYSFDYSGVHFAVLNTNDINSNDQLGSIQVEWLKSDLNSTEKEYKVVLMHKSLYSSGSHSFDSDVVAMRAQLTPIFSELGVSLVLAGHDHTYSTTYYLDKDGNEIKTSANGKSKIGDKGTLYVTLGTVGNKFYDWKDNPDVPVNYGKDLHDPMLGDPVFGKLSFDGKDLYFEAYQYDLETGEITELKTENNTLVIVVISVVSVFVLGGGVALTVIYLKKKKAAIV